MKHFLALAGIAAALAIATPIAAQADSYRYVERTGPRGGHYERDVHRGHVDRGHDRHDRRDYRKMKRHQFSHWRPGLERQHYRGFGRPVFHDHYYRVRAHDRRGRLVYLNVNAYTGVILSIGR
jgi:Ni/Co efflux regulator RcnB